MYYFGGGSCGCCNNWGNSNWGSPWGNNFGCCGCGGFGNNFGSSYAIVLVLFILLVIVIGSRFTR